MGYLMLTRLPMERVILTATEDIPAGTEIVVLYEGTKGRHGRLGFIAPKAVEILREELIYGSGPKGGAA
jgi:sRNA-binding carbon storage regulator CsrA